MGSSAHAYETFKVEKTLVFANFPTLHTKYHFYAPHDSSERRYFTGNLPCDSGILNH